MKINDRYFKSRLSWDRRFAFELGKWIARLRWILRHGMLP
jgi:hypothetical protein